MKMNTKLFLALLIAAVALTACASRSGLRDAERLALYRAHAGEPVDSIYMPGHYNGWTPLDGGTFALWTRPSQAWLIELYGPCTDMGYVDKIRIEQPTGRLTARFDRIHVGGAGLMPLQCTIREIRPLDIKAIRVAEKKAREDRQRAGSSGT
ncbi:MAG: hypothetical protein E6Q88_12215 [Lysobacteraceae bacterium]|nr:MAG: hypothetical protein E6Q88_12215 [Xanthomonadaceae bacterium]